MPYLGSAEVNSEKIHYFPLGHISADFRFKNFKIKNDIFQKSSRCDEITCTFILNLLTSKYCVVININAKYFLIDKNSLLFT